MKPDSLPHVPLDRLTVDRLLGGVKAFIASPVGGKAKTLFFLLLLGMVGINGLNVVNSYVGRDFITSIENRDMGGFVGWAIIYVGVFALTTITAVLFRFCEERLGLLWREWLTARMVTLYLDHRTYYRLDSSGEIANPDQRIADDIKAFTVTTLSFTLMFLNGTFTVVAFSGVLWSISPLLFMVAVLYAAGGSYLTVRLGRPLVGLNYSQLDKEANFRADLIHVRENAESVALLHRERRLKVRLFNHLDALISNFRHIIAVNRNLGFFTTGYNYLIQIIPALIVAPLFIRGEVEFGVITQAAMAFAQLLGAFSLIVTNFQSISAFAAVIARVGSLGEALQDGDGPAPDESAKPAQSESAKDDSIISVREEEGILAFQNLTLISPQSGQILLNDLCVSIPKGTRLLILGCNDAAKVALFRATAGIWEHGHGRIVRPEFKQIFFLPERPYMPPGTLRELLVRTGTETEVGDDRLLEILRNMDLMPLVQRAGGLDEEQDWDELLSLGEQQMLAFSRLLLARPHFAFLDRISTALNPEDVTQMLRMLRKHDITYLSLGRDRHGRRDTDDRLENYESVLEIRPDGSWSWKAVKDGEILEEIAPATS